MSQYVIFAFLLFGGIVAGQRPNCDATNSWQQFPDPTNCANYYRCENSQAVLYTCAVDLLYDRNTKSCNWAENVQCDSLIVDPKPPATTCPPTEDPQHPTHIAHPTDCTKFYKCLGGFPYVQDCPIGLQWNAAMMYCDYPENAQCVPGSNQPGLPAGEQGINKLPY